MADMQAPVSDFILKPKYRRVEALYCECEPYDRVALLGEGTAEAAACQIGRDSHPRCSHCW